MAAWSPSPRGHGHHNTQYRGHDTEARHAVGNPGNGVGRMLQLFLEVIQLHVKQPLKLVGGHVARGHDAQVIADKRGHALIFKDSGVFGEDRAGGRVFNVALDGHHAFATTFVENLVNQAQHFKIKSVGETRTKHAQ